MTYLIIINVVICLVLIGTFFMHSNNYINLNARINAIDLSLRGIQENWNYFNVLDKIHEEIEDTHTTLRQNLNTNDYYKEIDELKTKLDEIREEVSRVKGHYKDESSLLDIYTRLGYMVENNTSSSDLSYISDRISDNSQILHDIKREIESNGAILINQLKYLQQND